VPTYPPDAPAGESNARAVRTVDPAPPLTYPECVLADHPSAYWRLGERSGLTAVDVVGGKNGTISGGVTLGQAGALWDGSTAMAFDGSTGQIGVSQTAPCFAIGTGPFTYECWMQAVSLNDNRYLFDDCRSSNPTDRGFALYTTSHCLQFSVVNGTSRVDCTTPPDLLAAFNGKWHHVVVTLQRGAQDTLFIYFDGAQAATRQLPATGWNLSPTGSWPVATIGTNNGGAAGQHWDRLIDEVAIYPVALTATQIAAHFRARTLAPYPPCPIPNAGESNPRAVA
jgi:Concanavalin A-like lectin/glucanases superfamily